MALSLDYTNQFIDDCLCEHSLGHSWYSLEWHLINRTSIICYDILKYYDNFK